MGRGVMGMGGWGDDGDRVMGGLWDRVMGG